MGTTYTLSLVRNMGDSIKHVFLSDDIIQNTIARLEQLTGVLSTEDSFTE